MEGIPHGGCYWKDCKECFPPGTPYPQSWEALCLRVPSCTISWEVKWNMQTGPCVSVMNAFDVDAIVLGNITMKSKRL